MFTKIQCSLYQKARFFLYKMTIFINIATYTFRYLIDVCWVNRKYIIDSILVYSKNSRIKFIVMEIWSWWNGGIQSYWKSTSSMILQQFWRVTIKWLLSLLIAGGKEAGIEVTSLFAVAVSVFRRTVASDANNPVYLERYSHWWTQSLMWRQYNVDKLPK